MPEIRGHEKRGQGKHQVVVARSFNAFVANAKFTLVRKTCMRKKSPSRVPTEKWKGAMPIPSRYSL